MEDAGSKRTALGDYIDDDIDARSDKPAARSDHVAAHYDSAGPWAQFKAFFTADHDVYAEGMRRGGHVLVARVDEADAESAAATLNVEGTVDLGARETDWRSQGWMGGPSAVGSTTQVRPRVGLYDADIPDR